MLRLRRALIEYDERKTLRLILGGVPSTIVRDAVLFRIALLTSPASPPPFPLPLLLNVFSRREMYFMCH